LPLFLLSKEVFKKFSSNQTNLRANLIKLGVLIALIGSPVSIRNREMKLKILLSGSLVKSIVFPRFPRFFINILAKISFKRKIWTLRSQDGDGNGNATKAIGLISKTTVLHLHHAFLYISLPSLHDYDVKMPDFTYRVSTQATTKFPLSF